MVQYIRKISIKSTQLRVWNRLANFVRDDVSFPLFSMDKSKMLSLLPPHHLIHSAFGFKHDVDDHFFQMANAKIGTARSHSYIGSRRIELYSVLSNTKSFGLFTHTLFVVVVFCVALESIYCGLQLNAIKSN